MGFNFVETQGEMTKAFFKPRTDLMSIENDTLNEINFMPITTETISIINHLHDFLI